LGYGVDPRTLVREDLIAGLRERGCRALTVCAPGRLAGAAAAGGDVVEDLEGTLLRLWKGRATAVALVRPDRFLAAVGEETQVTAAFDRLTSRSRTSDEVQPFRD